MSAYAKLRRRRQLFVDAYVRSGIGAEAAREIYPKLKRPDVSASKILANPEVKAAVAERTEAAIAKAGVRQVRVLEELARIAYFDPRRMYDSEGNLRQIHELEDDVAAAIASIEVEEQVSGAGTLEQPRTVLTRTRKYRHQPKLEALKLLGQYLKLFTEVHEHQGAGGGPIRTEEVSDLEKARRIAHLLSLGLRASQEAPAALSQDSGPAAG